MGSNKKYIVDASVIIKWYSPDEELAAQALKFEEDLIANSIEVMQPVFAEWELCNYFGRKQSPENAAVSYHRLLNYRIKRFALNRNQASIAFQIMKKLPKVSFYDASYHALAIHQNGTFLTCDKRYSKKAAEFGHIQLLSDYS